MFKLILSYIIIAFFAGCASNESGLKNDKDKKPKEREYKSDFANEYFPLKDSSVFIYINETDNNEQFTVRVLEKSLTLNGTEVLLSSFPYMTKDTAAKSVLINNQGEIEITDYMGSSGIIIPAAKNFKEGYNWKFGIFSGFISKSQDTVNTQIGGFSDLFYVILTDGFTFSFEMWFKKNIGIVKWGANRTNPPTLKPVYYIINSVSD
jgi:hypothetical protein